MIELAFTTGAFISPMKQADGTYRWVVTEFEDDTFIDGEEVNVQEIASKEDDLVLGWED